MVRHKFVHKHVQWIHLSSIPTWNVVPVFVLIVNLSEHEWIIMEGKRLTLSLLLMHNSFFFYQVLRLVSQNRFLIYFKSLSMNVNGSDVYIIYSLRQNIYEEWKRAHIFQWKLYEGRYSATVYSSVLLYTYFQSSLHQ